MTTYTIREHERQTSEEDLQYGVWKGNDQIASGWYFSTATQYVRENIAPGDMYREEYPYSAPVTLTFEQWQEEREKDRAFIEGHDA